jgi:hypothetical protein
VGAKLDLDPYISGVNDYLAGADSIGWPLLDSLERNLAVGLPGTGSQDEAHARSLLARIRSRFGPAEELTTTAAMLEEATSRYQAGIEALARDPVGGDIWNSVALRLFEKRMYEARAKVVCVPRRRPGGDAFWALRRLRSSRRGP